MGVALAGPRGSHELDSRRAALAVQGAERGGGPLVVAEHVLVDGLRQQEVGDGVVAVGEPVQLDRELVALLLGRHDEDLRGRRRELHQLLQRVEQRRSLGTPALEERDAVDDVTGGDVVGGGGRSGGCAVRPQRGQSADRQDVLRQAHAAVAHSALEAVAEQGGERLALRDAVEEAERGPHPVGREVDLERLVLGVVVRQVAAAQDGGRGRLRQRRGVHEAVVDAGVGRGTQVVEPAVRAEVHARRAWWRGGRPAGGWPARCTRRRAGGCRRRAARAAPGRARPAAAELRPSSSSSTRRSVRQVFGGAAGQTVGDELRVPSATR